MSLKVKEVLEESLKPGSEVNFAGRITEVLPILRIGDRMFERLIVADESGSITLMIEASPKYFLPGDGVRVVGRVRPCPYLPSERCVECSADDVEISEHKWIERENRSELDKMGPFTMLSLLSVAKLDERIMKPLLETRLEPSLIYKETRRRLQAGESTDEIMEIVSSMTLFSVFFRDLEAARVAMNSVIMVRGLDLPSAEKARLELMEDFLRALMDVEGFRPYILGVEAGQRVIETYPRAGEEEIARFGPLTEVGTSVMSRLRGEEGPNFLVFEVGKPEEDMAMLRDLFQKVAGASKARLLTITLGATTGKFGEVMAELSKASGYKDPTVIYLEGLEIVAPSDTFISNYVKTRELGVKVREESVDLLRRMGKNPSVVMVAVTSVLPLVHQPALSLADKIVGLRKKEEKEKERRGPLPYAF